MVWRVEHIVTGEVYAAKVIDIGEGEGEEAVLDEVKMLQRYKHPFVVEYKCYFKDPAEKQIVILMEYCTGIEIEIEAGRRRRPLAADS